MPRGKKDVSVILFDVNTQSHEKAVQTLMKICCNKFFVKNEDLTKLILFNSDATENRLSSRHPGYDNILEASPELISYNPTFILEKIENSGTGVGNWLEAVVLGLRCLEEDCEEPDTVVTYQILLITDFTKHGVRKQNLFDEIVKGINEMNAYFYIVGPEIQPPFKIKNSDDIKAWMNNLQVDENNVDLNVVHDIIQKTNNTVVCSYDIGWQLFFSYRNFTGSQAWQVPLAIGSEIQLPAHTIKILETVPALKFAAPRYGKMRWIDAEDESIEVEKEDVIEGLTRHEKFVRMPDNKMFKAESTRSFNILCFTDSKNVPEYMMQSEAYCVLPSGPPENSKAMDLLIDSLAQQNKYAIARRVYNNNFLPRIVVLVPQPDLKPKCFYLSSLPYADDIRVNMKETDVKSAPKEEKVDEIYNYLNSLIVDNDDSEKSTPLCIQMMHNINLQKLINKSADKFLNRNLNLNDLDLEYLTCPANDAADRLKSAWPEASVKPTAADNSDIESDGDDFDW